MLTTVASGSKVRHMTVKHKDRAVKVSALTYAELVRVSKILERGGSGLVLASLKGLLGRCVSIGLPVIERETKKK